MGTVFIAKRPDNVINDIITVPDQNYIPRTYKAVIGIKNSKKEDSPTIQGGRIFYMIMSDEGDDVISCYEDGEWKVRIEDEFSLDWFAQGIFLARWNAEPINKQTEEKDNESVS